MSITQVIKFFRGFRRSPDKYDALYQSFIADTMPKIAAGKAGNLKLAPKTIWLRISENCNLRCIGCYKEDTFKKVYADIEEVRQSIAFDGEVKEISFTTNEAMLHPQFCDIIDMCREAHPDAYLWVISNGTIPIKGRYKQAIAKLDKVGLSIDGATKEVYESIRHGARFEDFIKNTKAILEVQRETGFPKAVSFGLTATSTNLHELIDVVRLGHSLGISDIWAQAMQSSDEVILGRISNILLDTMDPALRTRLIDEARAEAARLGIGFYFSEGLYPAADKQDTDSEAIPKDLGVKLCQYPWTQPTQMSKVDDKYVVRPCCYMRLNESKDALVNKYGLAFDEIQNASDIYNSPQMWNFREKLAKGETSDVCGLCDAARGFQWKPADDTPKPN